MADQPKPPTETVEYSTPWFDLVAKRVGDQQAPFYALRVIDYVCVVAVTASDDLVLVRQFRPAVERQTVELPAGHVEKHQTPEQAARSELAEETGFTAAAFELLGTFYSDTGRNENRTWCYLASGAEPLPDRPAREAGIDVVRVPAAAIGGMILAEEFHHGPHIAAVMLAALRHERLRALIVPAEIRRSSGSGAGR